MGYDCPGAGAAAETGAFCLWRKASREQREEGGTGEADEDVAEHSLGADWDEGGGSVFPFLRLTASSRLTRRVQRCPGQEKGFVCLSLSTQTPSAAA